MKQREQVAMWKVQRALGDPHGRCYAAAEALYHLLGGKDAGYKPEVLKYYDGALKTHWYLRNQEGEVLDPTAAQFPGTMPYFFGRGCGFLTKEPSRRTRELLEQL